MRNRAKCKLCKDVLESFHRHDYVTCSCGQISIDGGNDCYKASALNWSNFLRVDDEGNEIIPKIEDANMPSDNGFSEKTLSQPITKKDLLKQLDAMIENIEKLPNMAMSLPINHYDFVSALILLQAILSRD
jgi:hypothetical protein